MDLKFHAITRKKWRITDTKFYYDKEEYPIGEVCEFSRIALCNGALGEGKISCKLRNGKSFILYHNYKERTDARDALEFVAKLLPKKEQPKPVKSVFRKRCKLCGAVYSYTLTDIEQNQEHIKQAQLAALSGITNAVAGSSVSAKLSSIQASAASDKVVDYTRCPKCNSPDIADISDEEFNRMQVASARPTAASAADEIKKFKELLDMGVITQEEFDAKKKHLLGL